MPDADLINMVELLAQVCRPMAHPRIDGRTAPPGLMVNTGVGPQYSVLGSSAVESCAGITLRGEAFNLRHVRLRSGPGINQHRAVIQPMSGGIPRIPFRGCAASASDGETGCIT